jgi:hypothetical protein
MRSASAIELMRMLKRRVRKCVSRAGQTLLSSDIRTGAE